MTKYQGALNQVYINTIEVNPTFSHPYPPCGGFRDSAHRSTTKSITGPMLVQRDKTLGTKNITANSVSPRVQEIEQPGVRHAPHSTNCFKYTSFCSNTSTNNFSCSTQYFEMMHSTMRKRRFRLCCCLICCRYWQCKACRGTMATY